MNNIIDKKDNKSCYVRCDCGGEILGFHYYPFNDAEYFYIHCYTDTLNKKDHYPAFYWDSPSDVTLFANKLIEWAENTYKNSSYHIELYDEAIGEKQLKRLGPTVLLLESDNIDMDIGFLSICKYQSKKHMKRNKVTWDIVLTRDTAKEFGEAIKQIIIEKDIKINT